MKKFFICFAGLFLSTPLFASFQDDGNPACVSAINKRFNVATNIYGSPKYMYGIADCQPNHNNCAYYTFIIEKDNRYVGLDVYCRFNAKGQVLSIQVDR
jgi:hypothetical protein